eukprot:6315564-Amphidinium_carterae.1
MATLNLWTEWDVSPAQRDQSLKHHWSSGMNADLWRGPQFLALAELCQRSSITREMWQGSVHLTCDVCSVDTGFCPVCTCWQRIGRSVRTQNSFLL